jgi:hypothetical protein
VLKKTVLLILASCAFAAQAQAQIAVLDTDVNIAALESPVETKAKSFDVGGSVELLQGTDGATILTPQYHWRSGKCDGFGFVDIFVDGGPLKFLGDNTINCKVAGPVFVSAEAGATNFGVTAKAGIGVDVPLPGMIFTRVTAYPVVTRGDGDRPQVKVTWLSKDLKLGKKVSAYTTGFARFRDGAPDVAQPQIWLKVDGLPFEVGAEAAFFGSEKPGVLFGIKVGG